MKCPAEVIALERIMSILEWTESRVSLARLRFAVGHGTTL